MQRAVPRHFTAYLLTALLYVGVIGLFYYFQTAKQIKLDSPKKTVVHRIEMTLSTFVPEIEPPEEKVEKIEEKIVEKIIEPLPPIVEKPKLKPIVKKKVIKKKKILKKKKVIKKKIIKKKTIKKKVVKKKLIVKKKVIKKVSKPKGKASRKTKKRQEKKQKPQASLAEKKRFLEKVRVKIEKNKYYPRIAQKRGIQGIVKVRFKILANGNVSNISVTGARIFHTSAKEAVKNSFPISIKNMPRSLLKDYVTIPLSYEIR